MERFLKLLDDLDDLQAFVQTQERPVIATLLLLVVFLAVLAGLLVIGLPALQAAP